MRAIMKRKFFLLKQNIILSQFIKIKNENENDIKIIKIIFKI